MGSGASGSSSSGSDYAPGPAATTTTQQ
jgi:hypothetical protein